MSRLFTEEPFTCVTCEFEILGHPVFHVGLPFCCAGCAADGPCMCSYDEVEVPAAERATMRVGIPADTGRAATPPGRDAEPEAAPLRRWPDAEEARPAAVQTPVDREAVPARERSAVRERGGAERMVGTGSPGRGGGSRGTAA
jgi:hypothetical protein